MRRVESKIKATPNHSKRTFTIRVTWSDGMKLKYRTDRLSKEDFNNELMNTEKDWRDFLRSQDCNRI